MPSAAGPLLRWECSKVGFSGGQQRRHSNPETPEQGMQIERIAQRQSRIA